MKREVVWCDRCHRESERWLSVEIIKGREPDPSGNGYNPIIEHRDFCVACINHYVTFAFEKGATMPLV